QDTQVQMLLPPAELCRTRTLMLRCPGPSSACTLKGAPGQIFRDHLADGAGQYLALLVGSWTDTLADLGMLKFKRVRGIQYLTPCSSMTQREEGPMAFIMFEPPLHGSRSELTDAGHRDVLHTGFGPSYLFGPVPVRPARVPSLAASRCAPGWLPRSK